MPNSPRVRTSERHEKKKSIDIQSNPSHFLMSFIHDPVPREWSTFERMPQLGNGPDGSFQETPSQVYLGFYAPQGILPGYQEEILHGDQDQQPSQ